MPHPPLCPNLPQNSDSYPLRYNYVHNPFKRLNLSLTCRQTLNTHIHGSFGDTGFTLEFAKKCDIITAKIEHVDTYVLEELSKPEYQVGGKKIEV